MPIGTTSLGVMMMNQISSGIIAPCNAFSQVRRCGRQAWRVLHTSLIAVRISEVMAKPRTGWVKSFILRGNHEFRT